ncbi:hypothetical protein AB9T88_01460 [Flavobacterium sp. LBUM151]
MENIKQGNTMKILKKLFVLFLFLQLISCKGQEKDGISYPKEKIMSTERFDIEKYKNCIKLKEKDKYADVSNCEEILKDGTLIISYMEWEKRIIPPAPNLFSTVFKYYKSGIIKEEFKTYIGIFDEKIGVSKYYDENGYLIKTVDEDIKYNDINIKLVDLFEILKKEPLLDSLTVEQKKYFKNAFGLEKEINKITIDDIFKYLKRDKILDPNNTDKTIFNTEDRFRLEITFNEIEKEWNVIKELYPYGQIELQVNAMTGKVSNKNYQAETRS